MVDTDLHVKPAFRDRLRQLTDEEKSQLEASIVEAGRVIDPILYWHHGGKNWIVDGHNRWEIAKRLGLGYRTEPKTFSDEHEALDWVLLNQFGRRNLTPDERTLYLGQLYNNAKKQHGGARKPNENSGISSAQIAHLKTADVLAEKAGVHASTVRRAGKIDEQIESLAEPLQNAIRRKADKPSAQLLTSLETADPIIQRKIGNDVLNGKHKSVRDAAANYGITASKPKPKDKSTPVDTSEGEPCPNCRHTHYVEDADGECCAKCKHPRGEPAGDDDPPKEDWHIVWKKCRKTFEAGLRAMDDLHIAAGDKSRHDKLIEATKAILKEIDEWKAAILKQRHV